MSDTRLPPLASSLPPGRRPWLPEGGRAPAGAGEGWRPPEAGAGHPTPGVREARRVGGRPPPDRTALQDALQRRARPASLLRPQRQIGRNAVLGCVLLLAGTVGGLVLGLSLRPGAPAPQQQRADAPAAVVAAPGVPSASAAASSTAPGVPSANAAALSTEPDPGQGGLPKAALLAAGSDPARPPPAAASTARAPGVASEIDTLRKGVIAERERLESITQARTAAEAQFAQLQAQREQASQREILARREAALASLPSVTAPLPSPTPRPPRAEPAAGVGGGVATGGAASHSGQQRVVLHHRAGSYAASEAAGAMVSQVREAGFDLNETRAVTATPSQRVVRYFHAEDAPAAARLAGRLGRGWALQDFRSYEPLPSPGLLEVWLPDR